MDDFNLRPITPETVAKAYRYYLMGLTALETAKLLDISARTVQRYRKEHRFKERAKPAIYREKIGELLERGFSYSSIAKIIQVSRSTVYKYGKTAK